MQAVQLHKQDMELSCHEMNLRLESLANSLHRMEKSKRWI